MNDLPKDKRRIEMIKIAAAGFMCIDYWPQFDDRYYVTGNGVDVLFNTIDQPTDARLREMESAYPGVFIGDGSNSLMWTYLRLCGYNQTSASVPCVFYVNADGKVNDYLMGQVSDVEEEVNGLMTYDRRITKINPDLDPHMTTHINDQTRRASNHG